MSVGVEPLNLSDKFKIHLNLSVHLNLSDKFNNL